MDQAVPGNNQPGIVDAAWALGADLPCQRPVRMQRRDVATGVESTVFIRCGTRVASQCPSCASLYRGDVAAVLRDGLFGTAEDEVIVLLTLTAPSFGETHFVPPQAPPKDEKKAHAGWERRFGKRKCRCGNKHLPGDKEWTGVPRDSETYDYEGQVRWNRMVPRLWTRTADELTRVLLSDGSRLPYAGVTEFQRRGAVHLHVLMRVPMTFTLDVYEDEGLCAPRRSKRSWQRSGPTHPATRQVTGSSGVGKHTHRSLLMRWVGTRNAPRGTWPSWSRMPQRTWPVMDWVSPSTKARLPSTWTRSPDRLRSPSAPAIGLAMRGVTSVLTADVGSARLHGGSAAIR